MTRIPLFRAQELVSPRITGAHQFFQRRRQKTPYEVGASRVGFCPFPGNRYRHQVDRTSTPGWTSVGAPGSGAHSFKPSTP